MYYAPRRVEYHIYFVYFYIYVHGVSKKILLTNMVIQKDDIISIIII